MAKVLKRSSHSGPESTVQNLSSLTTLETQQVAFLDTLEHALEDVVDHEDVIEFIYNPRDSSWSWINSEQT